MAQAFHTGILALYRKKALAEQTAMNKQPQCEDRTFLKSMLTGTLFSLVNSFFWYLISQGYNLIEHSGKCARA